MKSVPVTSWHGDGQWRNVGKSGTVPRNRTSTERCIGMPGREGDHMDLGTTVYFELRMWFTCKMWIELRVQWDSTINVNPTLPETFWTRATCLQLLILQALLQRFELRAYSKKSEPGPAQVLASTDVVQLFFFLQVFLVPLTWVKQSSVHCNYAVTPGLGWADAIQKTGYP